MNKTERASFIRNFVFGVEDSLVSTVGLLSGVAIAGVPRGTIFLTGLILVFVEAFSMGVGSFLSEQSSDSYMRQGQPAIGPAAFSALIMFGSYFVSGFIPLFPYVLWSTNQAFLISILLSLVALFFLGVWGGHLSNINLAKSGLKMMVIGGIAIALGVIVGHLVQPSLLN